MRLAGYQPLTLIDYPGHLAAIVFTQGCVFQCVYCHNPELIALVGETHISEEDVLQKLDRDRAMLDGVVVTGGEPTLHADLPQFLQKIKSLGLKVKLDTNGVHPRRVAECIQLGVVDFFAMDIKQRWEKYPEIIGTVPEVAIKNCQETCRLIQESGIDHEFRTTLATTLHTVDDVREIASYLRPGERYALQQVRYQKVLSITLAPAPAFDLELVRSEILQDFPRLEVIVKV